MSPILSSTRIESKRIAGARLWRACSTDGWRSGWYRRRVWARLAAGFHAGRSGL